MSVIIIISIYPQVLASYQHSYPQVNIHRYIHRCEYISLVFVKNKCKKSLICGANVVIGGAIVVEK